MQLITRNLQFRTFIVSCLLDNLTVNFVTQLWISMTILRENKKEKNKKKNKTNKKTKKQAFE